MSRTLPLTTRRHVLALLPTYRQTKTANGPQFMPDPQTFLNGKLWEAETYGHAAPPPRQTPNEIPGNWDMSRQGAYNAPLGQGIPHINSMLKPEFQIH